MRMVLTVVTLILNVLSILLLAATVVCGVFAALLVLNGVAIQFGGRFGGAPPKGDQIVGAFD
jgi:hypothetical protein